YRWILAGICTNKRHILCPATTQVGHFLTVSGLTNQIIKQSLKLSYTQWIAVFILILSTRLADIGRYFVQPAMDYLSTTILFIRPQPDDLIEIVISDFTATQDILQLINVVQAVEIIFPYDASIYCSKELAACHTEIDQQIGPVGIRFS